jgi:hypothetical protein
LTTLQASPKALSNEEATQKLMRMRLEANAQHKSALRRNQKKLIEREPWLQEAIQEIVVYTARRRKLEERGILPKRTNETTDGAWTGVHAARQAKSRLEDQANPLAGKQEARDDRPTPERLKRGDLVQRPLHGPDGFVVSHNYVSNFDVQKLSNSWPPSVAGAYALFVRDACKLGITRVSMNYERIGGPVSNGTFGIAIETDEDYQATADRHDFIMRKLHTFDATGDMSVAEVLNFVLCHVESVRLGTDRVKSWADVGRLFEPGYKDEATSKAHARSAFNVLGRFMAGCYLEFFAIYGGEMRKARVRTREVNP